MANTVIKKDVIITGAKGETGDAPENDTTVPVNGIIYYDGETAPTGYTAVNNS